MLINVLCLFAACKQRVLSSTTESELLRPQKQPLLHLEDDIDLEGLRPCLLSPACAQYLTHGRLRISGWDGHHNCLDGHRLMHVTSDLTGRAYQGMFPVWCRHDGAGAHGRDRQSAEESAPLHGGAQRERSRRRDAQEKGASCLALLRSQRVGRVLPSTPTMMTGQSARHCPAHLQRSQGSASPALRVQGTAL